MNIEERLLEIGLEVADEYATEKANQIKKHLP